MDKPYHEILKHKYFFKEDSESIQTWHTRYNKFANFLFKRFGTSAWRINEFANALRAEDISESYFREVVRYEMHENFNRIVKDKYNALNSQLADINHEKLTKTVNEAERFRLEIQLELLEGLIRNDF